MKNISELIEQAAKRTGLPEADLGPRTWEDGLSILVEAYRDEAELSDLGEVVVEANLDSLIGNRLQIVDTVARHPEITTQPVPEPWFVIGPPRTGTTHLASLLACDHRRRSLLRWEAQQPCPPPESATYDTDPRIQEAEAMWDVLLATVPDFKAIHHEPAQGPTEDVLLLALDFRSAHFQTLGMIPSYMEWLQTCDMTPAYDFHKTTLQLLQWRHPGPWTLKSPAHLLSLGSLLDTYPDARLIMTHRDPVRMVSSLASMIGVLVAMCSDRDARADVGRAATALGVDMIERGLQARDALGIEVVDVAYEDLVADPIGTAEAIYKELGADLDGSTRTAMTSYAERNPQGRHGVHSYTPSDYGIDVTELRERFRPYVDRFSIPEEPL